jgi:uncharacterized OB-fold protein
VIDYEDWGEKPVPAIDPESEAYWAAAAEGQLVVQHCEECGERQLYPRRLCRHCWSRDLEFEAAPGTGTLYTYTECHVAGQPGYEAETPYVVAMVELDLPAANPSGRPIRLTTHLVECDVDGVGVGDPVAVDVRQIGGDSERHLPVFAPVE